MEPCERHGHAGARRVCAHLARGVAAQAPVTVGAAVEVDLGELALQGPAVPLLYCRECAELHRLPARSHLGSLEESTAPSLDALATVCASCLEESIDAAEARR